MISLLDDPDINFLVIVNDRAQHPVRWRCRQGHGEPGLAQGEER